jgi:hypothetical protein
MLLRAHGIVVDDHALDDVRYLQARPVAPHAVEGCGTATEGAHAISLQLAQCLRSSARRHHLGVHRWHGCRSQPPAPSAPALHGCTDVRPMTRVAVSALTADDRRLIRSRSRSTADCAVLDLAGPVCTEKIRLWP